jgi:H+/gluconate symporter-like permease
MFMSSVATSAIAIIVAIVLFIFLCMKGSNVIWVSCLCAAIVALFAIGGFTENFFNVFMSGTMDFMSNMLLIYISGAVFGGVLNASGCNDRIGRTMVKVFGQNNVCYIIMVFAMIIAFCGVSPIVIVSYLAFGLLKQANLPRYIGMVAMAGAMVLTQQVIPGHAGLANVIPTMFLGTDLYAAPLIGIPCAILGFVLVALYVHHLVKQAKAQGKGYDPMPGDDQQLRTEDDIPSFGIAILPIIFIVVFCFVAILGFNMSSNYAVVYAGFGAAIICFVTCHKYIHSNPFTVWQEALMQLVPVFIATPIVVGFASVVQNTECFQAMTNAIMNMNMNPYVLIVIGTTLMCIMCADCLGGSSTFLAMMGQQVVSMGAVPAAVHRLTLITSAAFDSMPHNGSVMMILMCYGYNHKEGYKYLLISNIAIPMAMTILGLIISLIAY